MRLSLRLFALLRLRRLTAETDFGDLDPRQLAPMSNRAVITFAAAIFERNDLLVLALLDYFTGHSRAFDQRRALRHFLAIADEKHIGENAFLADFGVEIIDINDVTFSDAVLSTAGFDNCESHGRGKS